MVKDSRTVPPVEIPSRDNGKTYWMVYCELREKNEATRCTDNSKFVTNIKYCMILRV